MKIIMLSAFLLRYAFLDKLFHCIVQSLSQHLIWYFYGNCLRIELLCELCCELVFVSIAVVDLLRSSLCLTLNVE